MRAMRIEDIWARRDNGEPPALPEDEVESHYRLTSVRGAELNRYRGEPMRPDGRRWRR